MNASVKLVALLVGSHVVRYVAEYMYFTQCAGFWNSIFSWNSPTCRGLRWVSDSAMTNVVTLVGGYSIKLLEQVGR
jgi:lipopolysaccharide biosynthesis regulator YciM